MPLGLPRARLQMKEGPCPFRADAVEPQRRDRGLGKYWDMPQRGHPRQSRAVEDQTHPPALFILPLQKPVRFCQRLRQT